VVKRSFDVAVSLLALILLLPVLATIAVAVRLDSPGPALFRQIRVGRRGRPFRILKFRSMVRDAERLAAKITPEDDPRITHVGRFLRKWYLDELPQFLNVLRGDMSLVGPRPETPQYVALYTPEEMRVLEVRPGLVGPSTLAQMDEGKVLAGAVDAETHYISSIMHERVRADLDYLGHGSMSYDVALLVRQLLAIVRR
jgi:lipopolysaccharide/colanic/teichoic acid biosynthesis glycosyltransferase